MVLEVADGEAARDVRDGQLAEGDVPSRPCPIGGVERRPSIAPSRDARVHPSDKLAYRQRSIAPEERKTDLVGGQAPEGGRRPAGIKQTLGFTQPERKHLAQMCQDLTGSPLGFGSVIEALGEGPRTMSFQRSTELVESLGRGCQPHVEIVVRHSVSLACEA